MKAILRTGAALAGLLLFAAVSHGYHWVTPVTRCPYPIAPSPSNSGFYFLDSCGRLTGPHYYLVPPCGPHNGFRPGPIGQAITSGYLPHTLLTNKDAMGVGNMPIMGQKQAPQGPPQGGGGAPMQPYPQPMPHPGPMPGAMGHGPQFGSMQQFGQHQQFGQFGQMGQFGQFGQFNQFGQFQPMQLPRMDYLPPHLHQQKQVGYPTHPFTRSPRDFFMWGENLEDERARSGRPFPVP